MAGPVVDVAERFAFDFVIRRAPGPWRTVGGRREASAVQIQPVAIRRDPAISLIEFGTHGLEESARRRPPGGCATAHEEIRVPCWCRGVENDEAMVGRDTGIAPVERQRLWRRVLAVDERGAVDHIAP